MCIGDIDRNVVDADVFSTLLLTHELTSGRKLMTEPPPSPGARKTARRVTPAGCRCSACRRSPRGYSDGDGCCRRQYTPEVFLSQLLMVIQLIRLTDSYRWWGPPYWRMRAASWWRRPAVMRLPFHGAGGVRPRRRCGDRRSRLFFDVDVRRCRRQDCLSIITIFVPSSTSTRNQTVCGALLSACVTD